MSRQIFSLNDANWQFGQTPGRSFKAADVYDLPAVTEWLPATVPGNLRTDLLALGRIPDPYFAQRYQDSLWVEDVDWWYRRTLEFGSLTPKQRLFLIFEGIDYLSAIFVNGRELARHEGMFSRQLVEITDLVRSEGTVDLAVRLWGSSALPRRKLSWFQRAWQKIAAPLYSSWVGIYPDRSATLKCQSSFGWDFAPPIRTMGLWDEVSLVITGPVFIVEAGAVGHPVVSEHSVQQNGSGPAELTVQLTLDADQTSQLEVLVYVTPAEFQEGEASLPPQRPNAPSDSSSLANAHTPVDASPGPFRFQLTLPAGRSEHQLPCHLPEAALWQPWDRGRPHLYHLRVALVDPDGQILDEISLRTGIRTVSLQNWQFKINHQLEFMRGLNWVPADSFPGRLRREDYARLLTQARTSGANFLRVWGGGLREKKAFYDLCDELGLLVWQEFPFACMFLGSYPRHPSFLALVETECRAIVRQIRSHPSIIAWCGGNEFSQRRNRPLLDTLAGVVYREDGSRPFIPVSPSFEDGGDAHNWLVWHGSAPIRTYQEETARFLSEFGLQALPDLATLRAALPDPATSWETHHADLSKLARYASLFKRQPNDSLSHPSAFTLHHSQLAQATALQTAIEHMRRRKAETGGVCLWQFNEPWPAISWAIVDYFGRPKLAYRRLVDWYRPVLVSLNFPVGRNWLTGEIFKAEIWAINDRLHTLERCRLEIQLDGRSIFSQTFDLAPNSAKLTGTFRHQLTAPPTEIRLTLHDHTGTLLAKNRYDLAWADQARPSIYPRLRRLIANWTLW